MLGCAYTICWFQSLWVFHASVSRWFIIGVWVTVLLLLRVLHTRQIPMWFSFKGCKKFDMPLNKENETEPTVPGKTGNWYYHHHHVVPLARISLTLSRHFSLSFIASGRSSGLHTLSSHSCWMYVRAGCPAFARPYLVVHRSTSLMSSSLLLQKWPACLVRLTWIVFVMGGRWPYSWCLVGCCRQDLFNIARNILV